MGQYSSKWLFRITLLDPSDHTTFEVSSHFLPGKELPENLGKVELSRIQNQLFLLSDQGVFQYDREHHKFEHREFEGLSVRTTYKLDGTTAPYWMVQNRKIGNAGFVKIDYDNSKMAMEWYPINIDGLDLIGKIEGLSYFDDGLPHLWISGQNGILRTLDKQTPQKASLQEVSLGQIYVNGRSVVPEPSRNRFILGHDTKTIRIDINGIHKAVSDSYLLSYRLIGFSNQWSTGGEESYLEFTGLKSTKYQLELRAVDKYGREGPITTLSFRLLPPWYQHPMAYAVYFIILLMIGYIILRFREIHLNNINKRLNFLVEERTIELARANTASNEFLEVISHEVRNPLNGIANLVDLLHDTNLDPEAQRLAGSLLRSTSHLKQVFGDILSFAKLEYGYVKINQIRFSLDEMIEDLVNLYEYQAKEQNTKLFLNMGETSRGWYMGDADKLRTILKNFISNAVKYCPNGEIRISVSRDDLDENNFALLRFSVADNGPGVPVSEQKSIFKKFYRTDDARNSKNVGTGLGLALCSTLSELLGGEIELESEEGKGSNFIFKLGMFATEKPQYNAGQSNPILMQLPPEKTVLIVDDQEYNQEVLRGISMRLGYKTFIASNSHEVMKIIKDQIFGIVFLDWELPGGLNGGQISRKLRKHPNTRESVIIATTAHENDDIRQACLESGMDSFALKPFNSTKIHKIVAEAWRNHVGISENKAINNSPKENPKKSFNEITLNAFADYSFANPEQATSAVSLYLEGLNEEIVSLKQAIEEKDEENIAKIAHRLRSHSGLVNGVALNLASKELMQAARGETNTPWETLVDNVFREAANLKETILGLEAKS